MVQNKGLKNSFYYKSNPVEMDNLPRERNLRKSDLGGVIFGCKHDTFAECHSKQLFGLPGQHFVYVRNIESGLPLFLFNYSDRKMHGLYEAAGTGRLNINTYAWTDQGSEKTPFAAQVPIRIKEICYPLEENDFKNAISDNYYDKFKFWFELDHAQTRALTSLFKKSPSNLKPPPVILPPASRPPHGTLSLASNRPPHGSVSFAEAVKRPVKAETSKNSKFLNLNPSEEEIVSDWEVLADENSSNSNLSSNCSNSNLNLNEETEKERILGILIKMKEDKLKKANSENCDFKEDKGEFANSNSERDELLKSIKELTERMHLLENNQAKNYREIERLKDTVDQSDRRINRLKSQILKLNSKLKDSSNSTSPDCENSLRHFVEQCLGTEDVIYLLGKNEF